MNLPDRAPDLNAPPAVWRTWLPKPSDEDLLKIHAMAVQELRESKAYKPQLADIIHLMIAEKAHRFERHVDIIATLRAQVSMLSLQITRQNVELAAKETFEHLSR